MRAFLAVLFLTSAVHADVDKQAVRREVKRHIMKVLACYEMHGLPAAPRIVLAFEIRNGRVTQAMASGGGGKVLQDCVVGVFKRMTFPRSRDAIKVTYPIQICTAGH
ncbi:MAG: hypothetical protein M4D80_19870 [Myxococcota bacterium]|nr:hypothetical protein [Myxococcota bacterium]